jgi:uncharacterized protein (UPF0303 family)
MSDTATQVAALHAEVDALSFPSFGVDDAWRLGSTIRRLAVERNLGVAIDVRIGEQQVFHTALPGTTADNDDWIARKVALVRRFDAASFPLAVAHRASGRDFPPHLDPRRMAFAGGCVPIRIRGTQVGTVTVSGLPDVEDHRLVLEGIRAFLAG